MSDRPARTRGSSALAALPFLLASACASAPPTGAPASTGGAADTASTTAPAPSASASAVVEGSTGAASEAAAPAKRGPFLEEPPRAERPPPLGKEAQKDLQKQCKPMLDALNARAQKAQKGKELEVLGDLRKKPPAGMKAPEAEKCADLLQRSLEDYLAASVEVEATMMLKRMSMAMISVFESRKKLCPASEQPVPPHFADLGDKGFESTTAAWSAPTWKCLSMEYEGPQRFQYAVKSDDAAGTFEIIARGAPYRDGKAVDVVQRGRIVPGKGVELAPLERR